MSLKARDIYGVIDQSAWETAITSGMQPIGVNEGVTSTFNSGDFKSKRQRYSQEDNIARKGNYFYNVPVTSELDATDSLFFFKNLLGDYNFGADAPVAGANTHTITPTETAADYTQMLTKGFTFGGSSTDDSKGQEYDSCIVTSIEMPEVAQGVFDMNVEILAREETEGTITTTGTIAPTSQLFDTLQADVKVGVDASEVSQPITLTGLRIERSGIAPHYRASSNLAKRWILDDTSYLMASGTFEIEMSDTEYAAVKDDFDNSDKLSVQLVFTSNELVTGATPYSLTFDMPECKYTAKESTTDGSLRLIKFTFEAGIDSGSNMITVTAVNGRATL